MKKRKAPVKAVQKGNVESNNTEMCVGCQSLAAPVDLNNDTQAEILFASRWADTNFACVSCAFHGNLISQLKNALLEDTRRVVANCLVCQSSDLLLELQQIEGAHQALSHPVLEVKSSIIKLATPARKVCNPCAYTLQWLYKQSLKIYVKAPKTKSGTRNITVEEEEEEEKEIISNSRSKRTATTKIKNEPKPPSPPPRPARRTSVPVATAKLTNGKPPAARTSKYTNQDDSDTEDSEHSEPVRKKPSRLVRSIKSEPKTKKTEVLAETRSSRKIIAPDRFKSSNETKVIKNSKDAKPRRVLSREKVEPTNKTSLKRKVPERLLRQVKRQATDELIEYECDECSQVFYSGVSAGLHKLEHEGRYFTLELERCATPVFSSSSSSGEELEDEASSSGESKRKPRKPEKPVKNAARDRLNSEAGADSNFVFVAPLRVSCPKGIQGSDNDKESINFGFEKPIVVTPEEKENEFSDEEEEGGTECVDSCISSLENSENQNKSSDEEKNEDPVVMENGEKTDDTNETSKPENNVSKNDTENASSVATNINQALSFDFEAPQVVPNSNENSSNKKVEETSVTKSNCLKFDFDEPAMPTVKIDPPKTISSALCFDYDPPVNDVMPRKLSEKISPSKIMAPMSKCEGDKFNDSGSSTYLSTENDFPSESVTRDVSSTVDAAISDTFMNAEDGFATTENSANMLSNNIDTSHALRDDSSNPTLPQSQQDSSFAFTPPEQNVTDLASLEKMVSQV